MEAAERGSRWIPNSGPSKLPGPGTRNDEPIFVTYLCDSVDCSGYLCQRKVYESKSPIHDEAVDRSGQCYKG